MNNQTKALLIVFIGTFFSGSLGIFNDFLKKAGMETYDIAFTKFAVAALFFGIYMLIADRKSFKINKAKDLWLFAFVAIANIALSIFLFESLKTVSVAIATAIQEISPYFTIIIAYFIFKEKITLRKIFAIFLAFGGCVIMCMFPAGGAGSNIDIMGLILALLSALCVSIFFLGSKALGERGYNASTTFFYVFALSAALMAITAPVSGIGLDFGRMADAISSDIVPVTFYVIAIGVISTLIPKFMFIKGYQMGDAGRVSVVIMFDLVTSALFAWLFLDEGITMMMAIGMLMILISVAVIELKYFDDYFPNDKIESDDS